jgi:hypothetical protein
MCAIVSRGEIIQDTRLIGCREEIFLHQLLTTQIGAQGIHLEDPERPGVKILE